jgi:hypothetical protein
MAVLVRPAPPESLDTVSMALGALNLAPHEWREGPRPAPPFEANEIRRQVMIHMGVKPLI